MMISIIIMKYELVTCQVRRLIESNRRRGRPRDELLRNASLKNE